MIIKRKRKNKGYGFALLAIIVVIVVGVAIRYASVVEDPLVNYYGEITYKSELQSLRDPEKGTLYCVSNPPSLFDASTFCFDSQEEVDAYVSES